MRTARLLLVIEVLQRNYMPDVEALRDQGDVKRFEFGLKRDHPPILRETREVECLVVRSEQEYRRSINGRKMRCQLEPSDAIGDLRAHKTEKLGISRDQ